MTSTTELIDPNDLVDAARFAARGYPHDAWTTLRREDPVHWCEPDGFRPFWAVTRHADIKFVSSHPEVYRNGPRMNLLRTDLELMMGGQGALRTLVNMDPPEHHDYRALAAPFFRPSVLRMLEDRVRQVTVDLFDRVPTDGEPFDFVTLYASWHPLKVICGVLGVAPEDEPLVLRIANTVFGLEDPDFAADLMVLAPEMIAYYHRIIADRRARPTDDLASLLCNAELHGEPIPDVELVSYFLILTSAGHDTTRNALAGGLLALLENPDQLAALAEDPVRCATAADEIVRWTSPVIQFCRTPIEDVELGGRRIRAGESLALFYPSGNRDDAVFDDPFAFRVDRDPNPHLGFGFGEHFCLGANLARMEIRVFLEELVARLGTVELAGPSERTAAMFVGGVKHLPVRWRLATPG